MTPRLRVLPALLILGLLTACSTTVTPDTPPLTRADGTVVPLKWEFDPGGRDQYKVPVTDVYLIVGEKKYVIQERANGGDFEVFGPAAWNKLPSSALTACYARWAGQGDAFYVTRRDGDTIAVYKGHFEEVYGFGGFRLLMELSY